MRVFGAYAREVIKQELKGLQALSQRIDVRFDRAVEALDVSGKVVVSGVGKSGHVSRKLAATMTSLGTPAMFMHPTEAAHGDLGLVLPDDAVLALSRSGKAAELLPLLEFCAQNRVPTVLISEQDDAGLARMVSLVLKLPVVAEAWGHAPTTSTIMQMALGDALAISLAKRKNFSEADFRARHPGGELGRRR